MNSKPVGRLTPAKSALVPDNPNAQIALKLRNFYQSVQDEALPQRFLDLLERLDAAEGSVQRAE
ncbi:NepR family anti-sigma factor [Shinella pollutisoli]|uniref:NepR family anti-sigma factor n=1 Tax=Shinella pollutisoli TaxID=2250594 RepID=A0ABV7DL68_9HYPH|nr:NepR family anti-sigma factor [Shinella pollutisoli]